jgi:hypothetical protein
MRHFIAWKRGEKCIVLSEGSFASPSRPSDRSSVNVKALQWLEAVVWDRGRGTLIVWINIETIIWKNNICNFNSNGTYISIKLSREGCIRSTQWQLGNSESSQHLLQGRRKPRNPASRWPVAGPSGFLLIIFTSSVHTSQETHYVSATETDRLMLFGETAAVYCENHIEHINTLCGQNAETLYIRIQSIPHRKHITSPLERPTG